MDPYAHDLIASKVDISQNKFRADPFSGLVDLSTTSGSSGSSGSSKTPASTGEEGEEGEEEEEEEEEKDSETLYYVESIDEGIDHYMFPRAMGYLILEKQYEL